MHYQQQPMTFWEGLLGGFTQGLLQRQQEKKDQQAAEAMANMYGWTPDINTAPQTINTPVPNFKYSALPQQQPPQTELQMNPQPAQPPNYNLAEAVGMQPQGEFKLQGTNIMPEYTSKTVTPTRADIQKQFNTEFGNKLRELAKSQPEMFKTYLPQLMQIRQERLDQLNTDFDRQEQATALGNMMNAKTYGEKLVAGIKSGIKPELMKMALDTGMDIKMLDLEDKYLPVGIDSHNNQVIDLKTGQPIDPVVLTKGINPATAESLALQRRGQDITLRGQNLTFETNQDRISAKQGHISAPKELEPLFASASQQTGVPLNVLKGVASAESAFNPGALSEAGAIGVMQLMPGTAQGLGVNPHDVGQNIAGGAQYLAQQYQKYGDWALSLAAYNAGPGAVDNAIQQAGSRNWNDIKQFLPQETRNYVPKVYAAINAPQEETGGLSKQDLAILGRTQAVANAFVSRWKDPNTGELREGHQNDPLYPAYLQAIQTENSILTPKQNGGTGQFANNGTVDYNAAITELTQALNEDVKKPSGQRPTKEQYIAQIKNKYGDLAPQIINDVNWEAWGLGNAKNKENNNLYGFNGW